MKTLEIKNDTILFDGMRVGEFVQMVNGTWYFNPREGIIWFHDTLALILKELKYRNEPV